MHPWLCFNPLTPGAFCQKSIIFLDILEIFRLDMGQISSSLLQKAFAKCQHAFLSTSIVFYNILARACSEIKIFGWESYLHVHVCLYIYFFTFPFSPLPIFLLQWLTSYGACFHFKTFRESIIEPSNFYRAYFKLYWADQSNLGINWKNLSTCRSWVYM